MANIHPPPLLKFVKIMPNAYTPTKGSSNAAGYDLKSLKDAIVPKRGSAKIHTGLKFQLPEETYGRVAPRSGLALNNGIDVGGGVIDQDYTGEVQIILFNHSEEDFHIKSGDRIAQLICEKIYYPNLIEVKDLNETERGENGFGSSGI